MHETEQGKSWNLHQRFWKTKAHKEQTVSFNNFCFLKSNFEQSTISFDSSRITTKAAGFILIDQPDLAHVQAFLWLTSLDDGVVCLESWPSATSQWQFSSPRGVTFQPHASRKELINIFTCAWLLLRVVVVGAVAVVIELQLRLPLLCALLLWLLRWLRLGWAGSRCGPQRCRSKPAAERYRRTSCIVRPLYSATPLVQIPKFGAKFNPLV